MNPDPNHDHVSMHLSNLKPLVNPQRNPYSGVSHPTSPSQPQTHRYSMFKHPISPFKHISPEYIDYDGKWVVPETPQDSQPCRRRSSCLTSAKRKLKFVDANDEEEMVAPPPAPSPCPHIDPATSVATDWSPASNSSRSPSPYMPDISPGTYDYLSMKLIKYHTP